MTILNDFANYTDSNGLVQPHQNPGVDDSGNGLLYSAEAIVALADNNALGDAQKQAFQAAYTKCKVDIGLMYRNPDLSGGQEGPDDYWGCGLASAFMDAGSLAKNILIYGDGKRCKEWDSSDTVSGSKLAFRILSVLYPSGIPYVYNNANPGKFSLSAWMGRFPALQAHLEYASGNSPSILQRIWWCASLLVGAVAAQDNHDSWILSWTAVRTWEKGSNSGLLEKATVWAWRKKFASLWGNPGDLLAAYFANPNHPLAVYLKSSL